MSAEPYVTKVFDTQAGFEYFWLGLKKRGFQRARALYHGRTRRFRVDVPCQDPLTTEAVQALDLEARCIETQALGLEKLWGPDRQRPFEE